MSSDHHALRLAATGGAALCTLIGIEGSFSRRIGAQIAVSMNGQVAGEMADNCLTEELASQSLLAMASGRRQSCDMARVRLSWIFGCLADRAWMF